MTPLPPRPTPSPHPTTSLSDRHTVMRPTCPTRTRHSLPHPRSLLSPIRLILCTVPFGLAAATLAIELSGGTMNVYSQIGLVLLVGIMAKNGILIVEFANQRRDDGASVDSAIREAATTRLRPVMMTMAASVLGALPLVFAHGAGAEARLALGWVIIGGLGFATLFTLFLAPVAYRFLAPLSKPRVHETNLLSDELEAVAKQT